MIRACRPVGGTFHGQPNVLPRDYFESLKKGAVLENDDWNTLLYQRGT